MFNSERQDVVRQEVLTMAEADPAIVGAAVTGSYARDAADRWSDIDLFLGLAPGAMSADVINSWTRKLDERLGVAHYFDLNGNNAVYRAFLLAEGIELDIGFAAQENFRSAEGQAFKVIFGQPAPAETSAPAAGPSEPDTLGLAWHHLIHARVCLERDRPWQSLYWTNALRDVLTTRMCQRLDLPTSYSKGVDLLPIGVREALRETVPSGLSPASLSFCLDRLTDALLTEIRISLEGSSAEPLYRVVEKLRDFPWSPTS